MKTKFQTRFLLTIYVFISIQCISQSNLPEKNTKIVSQIFKERLDSLIEKHDTLNQSILLKKWHALDSLDPQLFLAYSDYYQMRNFNNRNDLKNALSYLNEGIKINKNRIDLRERKMHILGCLTADRKSVILEIIAMIEYSVVNKNKWKELYSQDITDGENYMLDVVYSWIIKLYNLDNYKNSQVNNILLLAETTLKLYPNHLEFRDWVSYCYFQKKEYNKALPILLESEKMNPDSFSKFNEIASCYEHLKDKQSANTYYEKHITYLLNILSKNANNEELLMEISKSYKKIGDTVNSEKYLQQSKLLK